MRVFRTACFAIAISAVVAACAPADKTPPIYSNLSVAGNTLNQAEAAALINAYRQGEGLTPLSVNQILTRQSASEARTIASRVTSNRPGVVIKPIPGIKDRLTAAGYSAGFVDQNVGAGYFTLAEAFSGWRQSNQHRKTLLAAEATEMGLAAVRVPNVKYKVYWSLIVAAPAQ